MAIHVGSSGFAQNICLTDLVQTVKWEIMLKYAKCEVMLWCWPLYCYLI